MYTILIGMKPFRGERPRDEEFQKMLQIHFGMRLHFQPSGITWVENGGIFQSFFLGNPSCLPYAGDSSSQPKSSRASKSKSSQPGSFGDHNGLGYLGDPSKHQTRNSVFFPAAGTVVLTEGNEKEGLTDGRGFGGKKHHQVWCKAHFRCMFLKLPETILGCHYSVS